MRDPLVIQNLRAWVTTYADPARQAELGENAEERYQTWVDMLAAYDDLAAELEFVMTRAGQ